MWIVYLICLIPMLATVYKMKELGYSQATSNVTGIVVEIAVIGFVVALTKLIGRIKNKKSNTAKTNISGEAQSNIQNKKQEPTSAAGSKPIVKGPLLVYFDIDKLGNGAYGLSAGRTVAQAIPASMLEGIVIYSGDSQATLHGTANEYVVCMTGRDVILDAVEERLQSDKSMKTLLSSSGIKRGQHNEPLVIDGTVQSGTLIDPPGRSTSFCGVGIRNTWEKQKEKENVNHESAVIKIPESATPYKWTGDAEKMLAAIPKTWGVEIEAYTINETDAMVMEQQSPMDKNIRTEQAQYAVEQSSNSIFWHEYGAWVDFKYAKFLYKDKLYYINVSPTVKLTQTMYDRKGDLNNMAKILICFATQAGANRNLLLFVLKGELHDQT